MKLKHEELRELAKARRELAQKGEFRTMRRYIQHGSVTTYEHVCGVAAMSLALAGLLHWKVDRDSLLKGALLHDFYLYDWHKQKLGNLHGFHHPAAACRNAVEQYAINEKTQNIIRAHMWPLTLTVLPQSREAALVGTADKLVSMHETLFRRQKRKK